MTSIAPLYKMNAATPIPISPSMRAKPVSFVRIVAARTAAVVMTSLRASAAVASSVSESMAVPICRFSLLIELDEDGRKQYCNHEPAESDLRRVQNLGKALLQKLHADDQDHDRDRQPGQILIPGMAVGMLRVRRARAEFEADEADDIGAGIGEVVHAVGGDGNAAGQYTDGDLAARQQ